MKVLHESLNRQMGVTLVGDKQKNFSQATTIFFSSGLQIKEVIIKNCFELFYEIINFYNSVIGLHRTLLLSIFDR